MGQPSGALDTTIKEIRVSFLIDPPWLYATGRLYGRVMPRRGRAARMLSKATAGVFLATSVSLYVDRPWTRPIWKACRARSGRDWMLNSGVLRFDARRARWRTHVVSALLFMSYPYWLWLGERRERRRSGRSS